MREDRVPLGLRPGGAGKETEKEHLGWEGNICLNERGQKRGLRSMTVQCFLQDGVVWGPKCRCLS